MIRNWQDHYKSRIVSAAEAVKQVQNNDKIVMGHCSAFTNNLIDALCERASELRGIDFYCGLSFSNGRYSHAEFKDYITHYSLFATAANREATQAGRSPYIQMNFSEWVGFFNNLQPEVAFLSVTPPDAHGYVSLGLNADYGKMLPDMCRLVIAEVNPNMPRTYGDVFVKVEDIDYFVPVTDELFVVPPAAYDADSQKTGDYIATLIEDGACIQIGVGATPSAVFKSLRNRNDLGGHSEMLNDGYMELSELGVLTGKRKQIDKGKLIGTLCIGTKDFYQWLDNNPIVEMRAVDYTNDPRIIAQNDNVISVNACLSVDMLGQVASDFIGSKIYSGVGGQHDFVYGAKLSKGGKSILTMPSTASGGKISRICVALPAGQGVTVSRYDVDYVVTEHGIAHLKHKPIQERIENLINIADPKFRDELRIQAKEHFGW